MKNLLFSVIFGVFCTASVAGAAVDENLLSPSAGLDFSRSGYSCSSVMPADFLKNELGLTLHGGEEEYLNSFPVYTLKYNDKIAGRYVSAEADGGKLNVSASVYSYTAVNGAEVVWSPLEAAGVPYDGGVWQFDIGSLTDDFITVIYGATLKIDRAYVNGLINQYYTAAKAAAEKIAAENDKYNSAYAEYSENVIKYQNYSNALNDYYNGLNEYYEYLSRYAEWKRKADPYEAYLSEYNKYLAELDEYNSYNYEEAQLKYQQDLQRYQEYQTALKNYEKDYRKYLESINTPELATARAQIGIVDYIYTAAGNNRTIYGAVTGNTVTQVLARKEELKLAGADGKAVDRAGEATKNLRNLFGNYNKLTSEQEKYAYYITTYESLRDNFADLLRTLDYFYKIDIIRNYIKNSGKDENYCILVAQLCEISNALSEDAIGNYEQKYGWKDPSAAFFDASYKINGKTPEEILGNSILDYSGSPKPLENGYPSLPPEPEKPEEVEQPVFVKRPPMPVAPEPVPEPGPEPGPVSEPELPEEVPEPVAPVRYEPTEWEAKLAAADGSITYRQPYTSDYNLQLHTEVKKYFRNYSGITVYFYLDREAADYVYFDESINGSYIEYPAETPLPQKSVRGYTCTFSGWEYYDGTPVDFGNLPAGEEAVNVYPSFIQTPNLYDVIWVVEGVEYQQKAAYGTKPQFGGTPQKSAEGARQFRFTGWDREIQPMSDSAVYYYAQFERSLLITWKVEGSPDVVISVWQGETPEYAGTPHREADMVYGYVFNGWDKQPVPAQKDEVYTARFMRRYLVPLNGVGAGIEYVNGIYEADCRSAVSSAVDIELLAETAVAHASGIKIYWSNCSLLFTAAETYRIFSLGAVSVKPYVTLISNYGYRCSVAFTSKSGEAVEYDGAIVFSFYGNFDRENSRLFRTDGEEAVETRFSFDGTDVVFTMRGNGVYEIYPMYSVNIVQSEGSITVSKSQARRNEIITVQIGEVPQGRRFERIYVVDSNGNSIETSNDNSFAMPASDVTVGAVFGYEQYTVTFCAEGKIISRVTYNYGDEVIVPSNPVKAPDGRNSYVFAGWDKDITAVFGNVTYNAVFEAEPLPLYEGEGGGLSPTVIILISVAVGVFALIVAGITVTVILVKRKNKHKRAKNAQVTKIQ